MTKRERSTVERAIQILMADDGEFDEAIDALCGLIGWRYPAASVKMTLQEVDFRRLTNRDNQPFSVTAHGATSIDPDG